VVRVKPLGETTRERDLPPAMTWGRKEGTAKTANFSYCKASTAEKISSIVLKRKRETKRLSGKFKERRRRSLPKARGKQGKVYAKRMATGRKTRAHATPGNTCGRPYRWAREKLTGSRCTPAVFKGKKGGNSPVLCGRACSRRCKNFIKGDRSAAFRKKKP